MEDIIAVGAGGEAVPAPPAGEAPGGPSEPKDAEEIRQLWAAHSQAEAAAERGKEGSRTLCLELGKRLSEAKERLARPGRNGGWSSFVRSLGFSRAEADGLVRRYRGTLKPQAACTTEVETAMATPASGLSAADAEARPEAAEVVAVSAPATGPTPQPPEEASAITEEPRDETAATPTEVGQAAAVAEAGDGDVL
jgi:hypothetical protein